MSPHSQRVAPGQRRNVTRLLIQAFLQDEGFLPLMGDVSSEVLCYSLRLPIPAPFLLPPHPSQFSSPPSAPSSFPLTGIFLDRFLACLILFWHLFLEGLELIQEPMEVKQETRIIPTNAYFQMIQSKSSKVH